MRFAALLVMVMYFVLFLLARKEKPQKVPSILWFPFYCIAHFLYKHLFGRILGRTGQKQVEKDLQRLYPAENQEQVRRDYYVGKIALSLLICFVGTLFGMLISVKTQAQKLLDENGTITRGTYKEGARELTLEASIEGAEKKVFSVQIGARRLTEQELETLVEEFTGELPLLILGENESLEKVYKDLVLEETYADYPFVIEWHSNRPEIVTNTGMVYGVEDGAADLVLTANICYEGENNSLWNQEIAICVVPEVLSDEERFLQNMEEMLVIEEQESREEAAWKLPDRFQGKQVQWREVFPDYGVLLWVGALAAAVLVFFMADKDIHSNLEQKRALMKREYPDVVQKLVLYMGAGMTTRGAFQRIAGEYEKGKAAGKMERAIYEEICYACRELRAGVSESVVYEHLGKRTGIQEYIRLCTLLIQNLKKGNNTLLQRLREEADKACTEQLQNGRRLGEEASTKLLLPMVLMLVVVMLLIMIPAFSSVGI